MSQSLARVWLHVVFSTKDRRAYLQHDGFRDEMFHMIGYHVNEIGCIAVRAGGWHDHVHFVCGLARTVTIASLVEHVKVETSKWAKSAENGSHTFTWQSGYGAFSVSQSHVERVVRYVTDHAIHHRQRSFQDEFRELCLRHEIDIDERIRVGLNDRPVGPIAINFRQFPGPKGPGWMNEWPVRAGRASFVL